MSVLFGVSFRSTGIRDDLEFLMDEELNSIQLCALHMEIKYAIPNNFLVQLGFRPTKLMHRRMQIMH